MSGTLGVSSLCEAFQRSVAANPGAVALRTAGGGVELTWREYGERVRRIATGLAGLGVRRGDTVALMMANRPEFNLCDTAAMHLGATPFSVYNTLPADQIAHLFTNAENRVVICEAAFADRVAAVAGKVEHIVVVGGRQVNPPSIDGRPPGTLALEHLEERAEPGFDFEAAWRAVGPDDVLTLIYTSGTTGPPKGVELTHANMLAELAATSSVLPVTSSDRIVSYLPSAHVGDRWSSHYQQIVFGGQITCVADIKTIAAALADIRPTVWAAVPRVWEKLKAAVWAGIEIEPDPERRAALQAAVATGIRKVKAEQAAVNGEGPGPDEPLLSEYARADELALSGIRAQIGLDQVRWSVSGAAPASVDVLEFFAAIGLPICELWGMSELSCCATVNPPGRIRIGTVGPALPGVDLAVAADGELLCRGPVAMRGYRNEPGRTAETIDAGGWVHTGDVGTIDDDGYVRIVDRKKELIINAAGKNMSPANIESRLKSASPLIGQAIAIGDRRPYNVALVVLDPDACTTYAAKAGRPDASPASLCQDDGIAAAVAAAVETANSGLARVEQIKRFLILPVDWLPGGDELTPTMKLRRKPIAEKYASEIDGLYANSKLG